MSNQIEFNTKAIELTHDELECVAGGSVSVKDAIKAGDAASQAGLRGALNAANARKTGAKLAASKAAQTEYAKGI
jgi:hypothetical protein